ncbi:hypothetical protein CRUP_016424 [Coryphaenoides rupestris]|nr:hypothetical protein CRUP_016424 [Coryphaenoides rupestris]
MTGVPSYQHLLHFLSVVYVVTVLFNLLLIYVIAANHTLHSAKFVAVCNLAGDRRGAQTPCTIPGMIKAFLAKDNFMPFDLCLVQMFAYYALPVPRVVRVAVLAYGPAGRHMLPAAPGLRQHAACHGVRRVALTWSYSVGATLFATGDRQEAVLLPLRTRVQLLLRLRRPSSARWRCNDNTLHWTLASVLSNDHPRGGPSSSSCCRTSASWPTVFRHEVGGSRVKAF